jgi:type II secretory pathway component PulC
MADNASLTQQVVSPTHWRPWLYALVCVVAAFIGGGLAVAEMAATPMLFPTKASLDGNDSSQDDGLCTPTQVHSTVAAWLVEDWIREGTDALVRSATIVPAFEDGVMVGFQVRGLRAQSPLAVLGLANGDTVQAVAGTKLSSIDRSMAVYNELALAQPGEIDLEVRREGCPLTIRLTVL